MAHDRKRHGMYRSNPQQLRYCFLMDKPVHTRGRSTGGSGSITKGGSEFNSQDDRLIAT